MWTDGTLSPWEAVTQSADILMKQFAAFKGVEAPSQEQTRIPSGLAISPEQYNTSLSEVGLSTRAHNSLRRGGVMTLGQLIEKTREGLPPLPGFGEKSQTEVQDLLTGLGYPIPDKTKGKVK